MTQLVSFAFFLALSIVVSTRDWRDRKIYNRHLLAGLVFWSAAVLLLLLNSVLGSRGIRVWRLGEFFLPLRFYPQLAAHAALSLGVSFALWRMSVWPAGDA